MSGCGACLFPESDGGFATDVFCFAEKCLREVHRYVSLQEWENMIAGVRARLNLFDPKHAAFFREFCRGTQEVEMDTNGRILLPRKMLDEIGIDKEMVLAAQDSMIQVWDARVYEEVAISGEELGMMAEENF